MTTGRELTYDSAFCQISINQRKSTSLMVCSNYYQCFSILGSPFINGTDSTVKVMCFLHQQINVIEVSVVIQLRTFYHHKETVFILVQQFDTFQ